MMNIWIALFTIISIPTYLCSSSYDNDKRDYYKPDYYKHDKNHGNEYEHLLQLITALVMAQNAQIDRLEYKIAGLRKELNSASIIPPHLGLNFAICTGRVRDEGVSVGHVDDDLECPSGSIKVLGNAGENSNKGVGQQFNDLPSIEECKDECVESDDCASFNWWHDAPSHLCNTGETECDYCELNVLSEPNESFDTKDVGAFIYCKIVDEPCEIGTIIPFSGNSALLPDGYQPADGSERDADDFHELCGILGNTFGNGGCTLPKLTGKFVIGAGTSTTGATAALGQCGGDATLSVTEAQYH